MPKILKFEESKIGIAVLLTWLIFMPIIIIRLFNEFALLAIAMFALVALGMLASVLIGRKSSALKGLTKDERTEKFSMKSSRNGFLMAVFLTTLLAVYAMIRGWHIEYGSGCGPREPTSYRTFTTS